MTNISGNGFIVNLVASNTFPAGFNVSQWADDSDPFDLADLTIADTAMGANGDLIVWDTPTPIEVSLSVIPNSDDDVNMQALFEANRSARGKRSAKDKITLTGIYPDGKKVQLSNGAIVGGSPSKSITSGGRMRSRTYSFRFENVS